jgi:signal transduction histidine kinase
MGQRHAASALVSRTLSYLAHRRWAAVGLAILVEAALLLPLARADPSAVVGIPAAIAAGIGGTVAVVFGPLSGVLVAFTGAVLFGFVSGWGAGGLAALAVWPGVVAAAGIFARRVERQRQAIGALVAAQEDERQRVADELHDGTAQALTGALLALKRAESAASADEAGAATAETRALIQETIASVRELAVDLRPKVLDDFGLPPAVERLARGFQAETGIAVDLDLRTGEGRLSREAEVTLYRAVQEVLAQIAGRDCGGAVRVALERGPADVRAVIEHARPDGRGAANGPPLELAGLRERVRLAGGSVGVQSGDGRTLVRVALPLS